MAGSGDSTISLRSASQQFQTTRVKCLQMASIHANRCKRFQRWVRGWADATQADCLRYPDSNKATCQADRLLLNSDKPSKGARDDWCNDAARRAGFTNGWSVPAFLPSLGRRFRCVAVSHMCKQILAEYHASIYSLFAGYCYAETRFPSYNIALRILLFLDHDYETTSQHHHHTHNRKDGGRISTDRSAGDGEGELSFL